MSALLPISERVYELNLCAEHGYTYRNFKRAVRVYQSADYKSVLFLVYVTYKHTLPNRKTPYRNHFTMYRNADTVIVVRSETTLRFQDHDAALQYDVMKPTESYRATTACDWTVSFDKIQYSNTRPSFLSYTLVCSGEWWYFENGVILNGVTAYEKDMTCGHMFVYYELHPKYNIVTPLSKNYRINAQTRLLSVATASSSLPPFLASSRNDSSRQQQANPSTGDNNTSTSQEATTTATGTATPSCNPRTQLCSFLANNDDTGFNVIEATTLNSNIAPIVNTLARPIIQTNDAQEVPDLDTKTVVPSMFWFVQRSKELNAKCISYFLPKNFKTTPDTGGTGLLDNAYYNIGLPAVPLPQLATTTTTAMSDQQNV